MKKILAILTVTSVAVVANASTPLTFTGLVTGDSGVISVYGHSENVGIGKLSFTDGSNTLISVCADAQSFLDSNSHGYFPSLTPNDTSGLGIAGRIVAKYFNSATTADQAAGLQLAVWEALYDTGTSYDGANGNFFSTDSGLANAQAYAATYYNGAYNTSGVAMHWGTEDRGAQAQLSPVPEPASMGALALGIAAMVRRRRKSA